MLFLTGATGLLGLHILDELRARSLPVTALVRDDAGARVVASRGARPVMGAVEHPETWPRVKGATAIIHGAAIIAGGHSWDRFREVNVEGTRLAARRARELDIPLLHISSVAVYGRRHRHGSRVDEQYPFAPLGHHDFYARSKRMAEEILWEAITSGLKVTMFRPCVVYGEGDRLFLPKLVRTMLRSWRVPLIGGGQRPLALVHARNVAQAVIRGLDSPRARGQAYNVTNDDEITARGFLQAVERAAGRRIRAFNVPAKPAILIATVVDSGRRLLGPMRYPGSLTSAVRFWRGGNPYTSDKVRRDLGWNPAIKHASGVEDAAKFILTEPLLHPE
jgi:nucleoside-diphosphate-sugar epimerase